MNLKLPHLAIKPLLIALIFIVTFGGYSAAQELTAEMQTIELDGKKIYYWQPLTQRKSPLVVFSHDLGGCVENIKYLAEALAADGYWVAAMNHKDSRCANKKAKSQSADAPAGEQDKWDDKTYVDRKDDINNMLDAMVSNNLFLKQVDFEHVGMVGHGLGGYVAMGMAGAWQSWKSHHIKAVLALSPHTIPFTINNTLSNISAPIMYQGGTRDNPITTHLSKPDGVYNQTRPDKYLVVIDGAAHTAWASQASAFHPSITSYSVAFFDYYLRRNASAGKLLMEKLTDTAALYYDNAKGKSDAPKATLNSGKKPNNPKSKP